MADDTKHQVLIYALLLITAIIQVAADLPQLVLRAGIPLPGAQVNSDPATTGYLPSASISINTYFMALLSVILIFIAAYCGYKLIKGVHPKDMLRPSLMIAAYGLIGLIILFALGHVHIALGPSETEALPQELKQVSPALATPPPNLVWLAWIGLFVLIALLGIWLIRWQANRTLADDPLEREANRAVQAIRPGLDLRDVILRCYRQMSLALQKEQGIKLEETMTVREFERLLVARGIPHPPVQQLTRLFETARYGCQSSSTADEQKAVDCLNAIIQSSRALKQSHQNE